MTTCSMNFQAFFFNCWNDQDQSTVRFKKKKKKKDLYHVEAAGQEYRSLLLPKAVQFTFPVSLVI